MPERRKIIFIGPCYPFKGGISKYSARVAVRLAQHVSVEMHTYVSLYPRWLFPGRSEKEPIQENNDVPFAIRDLSFLRPWTFYQLGRRVRAEQSSVEGVILTWWTVAWIFHSLLLVAGLRRSVPLLFWCHNVFDHGKRGVSTWLSKWLLGFANGFVVHSGSERTRLVAFSGGRPVGLSALPPLHEGEAIAAGVATSLDRDRSGVFRLLFFGFVRPYKGLEDLIEALAQVRREEQVELTVSGECWGKMRRTVERRIGELGVGDVVHIQDAYIPDDQLAQVFSGCDAVVLPYREATGSGVVTLAHLFSRPAIVTDVGSLPEAVVPGQNGWVCRANDPAGLAKTILEAIRNPILAEQVAAGRPHTGIAWNALISCMLETLAQCGKTART